MKRKTIVTCLALAAMITCLLCKNAILRFHVAHNHEKLEQYALQMLENGDTNSGRYGLWKTRCYPDIGMVEFHAGGFGLAPGTTYQGFYYSSDDAHRPFSGAEAPMEIDGNHATWTDGTDNYGTSVRLTPNWFWFRASF